MDCREFRNKHVAYVDDLLPAVDMDAMQTHLAECGACSRQDTAVRRSLLLVRNLPSIEPSRDFMARLNSRLAEIGPPPRYAVAPRNSLFVSAPAIGAFAALAAGIALVAVLATQTTRYFSPAGPDLSAVASAVAVTTVDSTPFATVTAETAADNAVAASDAAMANAAYVAAVPTGIPIWPAVVMVGETRMQFANTELQSPDRR
jgi:putative zinc finger protein